MLEQILISFKTWLYRLWTEIWWLTGVLVITAALLRKFQSSVQVEVVSTFTGFSFFWKKLKEENQ